MCLIVAPVIFFGQQYCVYVLQQARRGKCFLLLAGRGVLTQAE